jgi:DNA polymerase I
MAVAELQNTFRSVCTALTMTVLQLRKFFRYVWLVDFEFHQPDGEQPTPLCLVAKEFFTGKVIRQWAPFDPFPPYEAGGNSLVVSYYSTAELGCYLALNWPMPEYILDLYAEFRRHTCGLVVPNGNGLLGALAYYGLPSLERAVKDENRALAMRGGPYTEAEKIRLSDYCHDDVLALERLLPALLPGLDLMRALIRGRYMAALARVEWRGVPINAHRYTLLRENWDRLQLSLIAAIDRSYCVYEGRTFKQELFAAWLKTQNIPWPVLESGNLAMDEDTFKDQARVYPVLNALKELRSSLSQMRLSDLKIGHDSRNRCLLSPFASRTGRNQPSNTKFVFGPAVWLRNLIQAPPGLAIAHLDYEQQEFAIAAYLSDDEAMMAAYRSGDPYLAFAKQAGAVPPDATKQSHKAIRDAFKICALAVQYGMEETSLGYKLGLTPAHGRELLQMHRTAYPRFWRWSQAVQDWAMLHGSLTTTYGWTIHVNGSQVNPRSLRNFPVQGNGAEMLRLAIILADEGGVEICGPIHDAVLLQAASEDIDEAVERCRKAMIAASELVLPGFPLRVEAKTWDWTTHYSDDRGAEFWKKLWSLPVLATTHPIK